ncbi:hypothetical protein ALC53_02008 [Atta colombica]|uniref:Uncharacterized protein n=1 Tax=Atta colombica TaxID=520822 RepID=A0A195BTD6_9HYME|nr:hypothetical protein ALC53_02008 [Atta colombica]
MNWRKCRKQRMDKEECTAHGNAAKESKAIDDWRTLAGRAGDLLCIAVSTCKMCAAIESLQILSELKRIAAIFHVHTKYRFDGDCKQKYDLGTCSPPSARKEGPTITGVGTNLRIGEANRRISIEHGKIEHRYEIAKLNGKLENNVRGLNPMSRVQPTSARVGTSGAEFNNPSNNPVDLAMQR